MSKLILTPLFPLSEIHNPEAIKQYALGLTEHFNSELAEYRKSLDVVLTSTSPLFIAQVLGDDPYFQSGEKATVEARLECAKVYALEIFNKAYWEKLHCQIAEKIYPTEIAYQASHFFKGDEEIGKPYLDFKTEHVLNYVSNYVLKPMDINSAHSILSELIKTSKRAVYRVFSTPNNNQLDIVNIGFYSDSFSLKVGMPEILTAILMLAHQNDSIEKQLAVFSAERKNLSNTFFIKDDSKIGLLDDKKGGFIRGEYREFLLKFANDLGLDILQSLPKPLSLEDRLSVDFGRVTL